jgi:hypothetical protein
VKSVVLPPGGFDIDLQRPILNAPYILLNGTHVPRKTETVFEEGRRDRRAQENAKVRNETV